MKQNKHKKLSKEIKGLQFTIEILARYLADLIGRVEDLETKEKREEGKNAKSNL